MTFYLLQNDVNVPLKRNESKTCVVIFIILRLGIFALDYLKVIYKATPFLQKINCIKYLPNNFYSYESIFKSKKIFNVSTEANLTRAIVKNKGKTKIRYSSESGCAYKTPIKFRKNAGGHLTRLRLLEARTYQVQTVCPGTTPLLPLARFLSRLPNQIHPLHFCVLNQASYESKIFNRNLFRAVRSYSAIQNLGCQGKRKPDPKEAQHK
jgi:hypothetical protein